VVCDSVVANESGCRESYEHAGRAAGEQYLSIQLAIAVYNNHDRSRRDRGHQ
jgi:hypothetical protein